jgi:hypothetical protein
MTTASTPAASTLVGLAPGPLAGRRFGLADGFLLVGRGPGADVGLADRHVSRRHAAPTVAGGQVVVEDLGSSGGTFVNGRPVHGWRELHPGDVVEFAVVRMRYEGGGPGGGPGAGPVGGGVRYDIDRQLGEAIINVGGNYYHQQRDGLLREIAAARTRGRRLIGVGAVLFLAGAAVFAAAVIGFMSQIVDGLNGGAVGPPTNPFGPPVFGVPAGLLGWALAAIGVVVTVIGIVQHVVATARRRRVHRSLPL